MSSNKALKNALKSITGKEFIDVAKAIISEESLSEKQLFNNVDDIRKQYPAYDELYKIVISKAAQNEKLLWHASGMELIFRL